FQRADGSRVPAADCPLLAAARSGVPYRNADDIFTRKDGTRFPVAYTSAPIERGGRGGGAGVALRDMSEREGREARQARRARLPARRAKVAAALAEAGELRGVLQRCAEALVRHLDAALARVWTLNEAGDVLELQASAGLYTHTDGGHARVPV